MNEHRAQTTTIPGGSRPPIMSRALALFFASSIATGIGFYLLLSVVPKYAVAVGAGGIGAGLTTGAMMLTTVAGEFVTPRLVSRFGQRTMFVAGLLLLGAPAFALAFSTSMVAILAICLVRGLGFAIVVVMSGALVASLVPAERRGEGLGLYGIVVDVPSVVAMPLGVWLAGQIGYGPAFVAGAVASLAGLIVVPILSRRQAVSALPVGVLAGLRTASMVRPALVFLATTMAGGIVTTFVPLAVTQAAGNLAALALLAQTSTSTVARWWAGRYGDRHGSAGLLIPGLLASTLGVIALILTSNPIAVVAGMVLFGAGFGVTGNATLSLMFQRAPAGGNSMASAIWNGAYDAGWGAGATGFGVIAGPVGYPAAFALTAALMLVALVPARQDRTAGPRRLSAAPDDSREAMAA